MVPGPTRHPAHSTAQRASFAAERLAIATLVLLLVALALAAGLFVGGRLHPPHPPLPPLPPALSIDDQAAPQVGTTYTSRMFGQPMTFQVIPRTPGT